MIRRSSLLALAIIAGCVAGSLYYISAQRVAVVAAARAIDASRPLIAEDLELRPMPLDALPDGAVMALDDAVGRIPIAPLWRGQLVVSQALSGDASGFRTGLRPRTGERAIAIPVNAIGAVGGAVAPGSRVDVLSIPVLGRAPAGRSTELLIQDAVVLDVRTESGSPALRDGDANPVLDRIASVVIAIPASDEIRFADRIATSSFVLVLSAGH